MSTKHKIVAVEAEPRLRVSEYVLGFVLSLITTLTSYFLVVNHRYATTTIEVTIVILALIQFVIQLIYFLHLRHENGPRWKLGVFIYMLFIVILIVFGSIWIINNLNSRMSIPNQIKYLNGQDGL